MHDAPLVPFGAKVVKRVEVSAAVGVVKRVEVHEFNCTNASVFAPFACF